MCYLPPRQHNESMLSFALRAITPFRYVSEAQFKETQRCPRGAQPHIIHVQDDIARSATLGDQFFTCPTKACTNGVLHADILLADERDFVMSLYKAFRTFALAQEHHHETIQLDNSFRPSAGHDKNECFTL
ncbi:hypothetical protein AAF712_004663 [Marasmius tenuissimus]|uniref:Uncharacterized protein n=1 Tax=Marasmius tenuissimus TaxID=585030 RepID=A0ABR3A319_9AGAR